ncbi:MAG: peptidoglycan-binding domain-containing protein [Armatimonadota bacterium]
MFKLRDLDLDRICELNEFLVPQDGLAMVGIRGCLPAKPGAWGREVELEAAKVDYTHPRCTIILWQPRFGSLAAFPGSTVPHISEIKKAAANGGRGANCLMTGCYSYVRGWHRYGSRTAHQAFRQDGVRPLRRTRDDLTYSLADPVEISNPGDNLHAGWCDSVDSEYYGSAGCQVVVGRPTRGHWRTFYAEAVAKGQTAFTYLLLTCRDIKFPQPVVRFGSRGPRTKALQEAMIRGGRLKGPADGVCGPNTFLSLVQAQGDRDTGVFGVDLARQIGARW